MRRNRTPERKEMDNAKAKIRNDFFRTFSRLFQSISRYRKKQAELGVNKKKTRAEMVKLKDYNKLKKREIFSRVCV